MKNFIFYFVGFGLLALVLFFFIQSSDSASSDFQVGIINPLDNIKGNKDSSIVLMEYSDFQCPACRSYYPILREVMVEFGDKIAFVYRHFPLINIHPNAEFAARAAQAAGKQGKFWEMHDLLFEKQNEWAKNSDITSTFISYATLLGISVEQFEIDFKSKETKDFVKSQRIHSLKSGLSGTPTFFVNGKKIDNPNSIIGFKEIIKKAIESGGNI